jgi:hypothetical protein
MDLSVHWTELQRERNRLWSANYCLYAYLHPERDWLLYLGKAGGSTVRQRLSGDHKHRLFRDIRREYGIEGVRVLVGVLELERGRYRTSELLADVESLLIKRLQPYGNISARSHRISRPGMRVHCVGGWPFRRESFRDA